MILESVSNAPSIAVAALLVSVVSLWISPLAALVAVAGTISAGYIAGVMHGLAALWLLALAGSAWSLRTAHGWPRLAAIGLAGTLGLLLGLHILPGFSNPVLIRDAVLASDALPYTQYVNFDKTLAAVLLLGCSGWTPLRSTGDWRRALRLAVPWIIGTVVVAMAGSLALGFVRFEPRWSAIFVAWAAINLLTTCVSEETFFRGLIQREIKVDGIALVASAGLFGLAHIAGGWPYVLLATLAGVGYATVYRVTARLEMAILTHFTVNAVHFLLFTYPALHR
jgi:uncharacterized protein